MRNRIVFIAVALVLSSAEDAQACQCVVLSPKDALKRADAVFTGKVTKILEGRLVNEVTIEVTANWKGISKKEVIIYAHIQRTACGYEFHAGENYLIYAQRHSDMDVLTTDACSTMRLAEAEADLKVLGKGATIR